MTQYISGISPAYLNISAQGYQYSFAMPKYIEPKNSI